MLGHNSCGLLAEVVMASKVCYAMKWCSSVTQKLNAEIERPNLHVQIASQQLDN